MTAKKRSIIAIILISVAVVLIAVGIVLVVVDNNISNEVSKLAKETLDALSADPAPSEAEAAALKATLKSKLDKSTVEQAVLTAFAVVTFFGGIASAVIGGKLLGKNYKEKHNIED